MPIKTYAIQRPSSKLTHKVLLVPSPIPIIAYAIQRPSSNLISKSIIGTIPNANNSLRHPAPHQIICLNQILRRRKESRTIRVWRGEWMKNRTPHTLALKSLDIFWSWSIWSQIRLWCCHSETYYVWSNQEIDSDILQKYQSKFDAVPKYQKVNGDLWSCYFWSQDSIIWFSALSTSDSVM